MAIPKVLQQISSPPKKLYFAGETLDNLLAYPRIAVVGSRNVSPYGKQITAQLVGELAQRGIVIISGLAYGVDAIAHRAALEAGGKTIAVLPSPLEDIAPRGNRDLAQQIIDSGGALVSEYNTEEYQMLKTNFVARNRLVAGLAQAVLITEAVEKSGSLHTARFALEQGKDVLAVPGNITSTTSVGTNNLLKSGATLVTSLVDVLRALGLAEGIKARKHTPKGRNPAEQAVIDLLKRGVTDGDLLQLESGLDAAEYAQTLTMLEITGKITPLGANQWTLS
ncbi:MAG: DNA-processing protein DprA [Candidatus Saccharimonadales bacterium]